MSRTTRRMVGVGITLVATVGLAVAASGVTSAYFSDVNSGTISGTVGYVKVSTGGGGGSDGLNITFNGNMLPGEKQSVTFDYKNIGSGPEDIWITFPTQSALHALNNLGQFGYIKFSDSSAGTFFESSNLNDGRRNPPYGSNSCGTFSDAPGQCNPVPTQMKVRSDLPVGAEGTVTITFMYSPDLGGPNVNGGPIAWNVYPPLNGEAYGPDASPSGTGLPYNVVATQVGQTP